MCSTATNTPRPNNKTSVFFDSIAAFPDISPRDGNFHFEPMHPPVTNQSLPARKVPRTSLSPVSQPSADHAKPTENFGAKRRMNLSFRASTQQDKTKNIHDFSNGYEKSCKKNKKDYNRSITRGCLFETQRPTNKKHLLLNIVKQESQTKPPPIVGEEHIPAGERARHRSSCSSDRCPHRPGSPAGKKNG